MATDTTYQKPSSEVFKDIMVALVGFDPVNDAQLINDLYAASDQYFAEGIDSQAIPTLLAGSTNAPASYKKYLGDYQNLRKANVGITSVSDLIAARNQYKKTLSSYGLSDLATDESADKFLANGVSPQEASDRISLAYNTVLYADTALKDQLKTFFPSLTTKDLVSNMLGVGQTTAELQKKVSLASLNAAAASSGLKSTLNPEEVLAQGLGYADLKSRYSQVAQATPATEAAAARAGIDTQGIQTELEKEALLGMASQRRKKAQQAEQNLFRGSSGTANVSIGKSSAGAF